MSYTYTTYKAALAAELVVDVADPDFLAILPTIIQDAEQRIYRELDLLSTVVRQTGATTLGDRDFTLPTGSGRFVVTNGINVITPAGESNPDAGTRTPLLPVSRDYMDAVWASASVTGEPVCYAMITDQEIIVGPPPDATYTLEVIGTIRPAALSEANATTYLTDYLPDLFFSASMVAGAAWQKNWGASADDPKMAVSWEAHYQTELASANTEEQRKRYASRAWGSLSPTPIASPNR